MDESIKKRSGSYFTPEEVVIALSNWAIRGAEERLLDPSCGDGRFLARHAHCTGVENDLQSAALAAERAKTAIIHKAEFFEWANTTTERFDCAVGNPPFIRYQHFSGEIRKRALQYCKRHGADFSSLTSSWAPFLVGAASLLKAGGRMAFVVPAEIGHAPYAAPLMEYLVSHFKIVHVVAIHGKLFPDLNEDCWLLYADGFGEVSTEIRFSKLPRIKGSRVPPANPERLSIEQWRQWNRRLRPFLMPRESQAIYLTTRSHGSTAILADVARVGIGYVTGANDFFHLRPSQLRNFRIPKALVHPAVRNGKSIRCGELTPAVVDRWISADDPVLLLRLNRDTPLPKSVIRYLETDAGRMAQTSFKCRSRDPWYAVPDVVVPDAFLSYMAGESVSLVANEARCVGTNSVHVVRLNGQMELNELLARWATPFTTLSCEVEGHPLGGGMLKLEPAEAGRVMLASRQFSLGDRAAISAGIQELRKWRNYG